MRQAGAITVDGDGKVYDGARTGENPIVITDGATVDAIFAAYLRAHGFGSRLVPLEPADTAGFCPVDGTPGCRTLEWARQHVADRIREHPLLPGAALVPGEVTDTRRVVDERGWHVITVCDEQGIDWRRGAKVRVGWAALPYLDVFRSEPYPDPHVPHREPVQPQPTIQTPKRIRRWLDAEVAAGRTSLVAQLPSPDVRRSLRETVGLSLQQAAELACVTSEAVRLWETGAREPHGQNRDRYVELLGAWGRASRQESGEAEVSVAR
jgi:DNA-binding transcriptional regulator YiaG